MDSKKIFNKDNGSLIVAAIVIIWLCRPVVEEFPAYIHAWAQSDWYAIAVGYVNNGYDLFHPETMIYNKQFPGLWAEASETTTTSADFPIHEYIVALLMGLTGSCEPRIFRIWTLIVSIIGLCFFYLLCKRLTKSAIKALGITLIAITSPVYSYYMAGFLPSIPSVAMVMAGMWAYVKYYQEGRTPFWHMAIALLTLAAMVRTSQLIALVAVCGFELLRVIRKESTFWNKVPAVALGFAAIGGYYLWNAHLKAEYGTLFLGSLMPLRNGEDYADVMTAVHEKWQYAYYSLIQQIVFAIIVVAALVTALIHKKEEKETTEKRPLPLYVLTGIWLLGELLFVLAMWRQFKDHDYYFIDCLWLPVLILIAQLTATLPSLNGRWWRLAEAGVLVALCWLMIGSARAESDKRKTDWDLATINIWHYKDSDKWLDSLGVSREARIMSLVSYPQNSPFLMMGRKGYSVMWFGRDTDVTPIMEKAQDFPFDYIVVEDYAVELYFEQYRTLMSRIVRIEDNGDLSLCMLADTTVNESANDFFTRPPLRISDPQCHSHCKE